MQTKTLLNAQGIAKQYGKSGFKLEPISSQLQANKITGLVGENGNGKTTLLKILARFLEQDGGTVSYPGMDAKSVADQKFRIGYISQELKTWVGSVYENLYLEASLHGILGSDNKEYVDALLKELELWEFRNHNWSELSGGYKMRFELAKTLIGKPSILILDEPLANLDIKAQDHFLTDIKKFQRKAEYEMAVIVSSQHLYKIEEVADHLIFLRQGKCLFNDEIQAISDKNGQQVIELSFAQEGVYRSEDLVSLGAEKVKFVGKQAMVYLPQEISGNGFLKKILDKDMEVLSYRNISNSTRQFFEHAE